MSRPHTIKLRAPWWCVAGSAAEERGAGRAGVDEFKTTVPLDWPEQIPIDFTGTVRVSRKFNCSSGMSDATEIWVVISSLGVPAEVRLNDSFIARVAAQSDLKVAVSKQLKPFNELQILLEVSGDQQETLIGDVAIEIIQ